MGTRSAVDRHLGRRHPVPQGTLPRAAFTSEVRVRTREGLGGWCRGSLSRSPGARRFGRERGRGIRWWGDEVG